MTEKERKAYFVTEENWKYMPDMSAGICRMHYLRFKGLLLLRLQVKREVENWNHNTRNVDTCEMWVTEMYLAPGEKTYGQRRVSVTQCYDLMKEADKKWK